MRQVLPIVDLRTPEQRRGLTKSQRNIQAITGILRTLGAAEQVRRERQQLDTITRAIAGGATTIEAINTAVNQAKKTQFGTGIQGILQRIGGAFQPSPGGGIGQSIQQMIIGQRLKQALMPKFQIPSGLEPSSVTVGPEGGVTQRYAPPKPKTGAQRKPLTASNMKEYSKGMDAGLKKARDITVGPNYTKEALLKAWQNFKDTAGWENLNDVDRKQLWTLWNNKIKARRKGKGKFNIGLLAANEYEWDPNDPDVIAASGLGDYDYKSATEAGFGPDEKGHWDSQFKSDDSAERFIDGLDTKAASLNDVITTYTRLAREELGAGATPEQIAKKAKELAKSKGWKFE